jgi:hypothetical protein
VAWRIAPAEAASPAAWTPPDTNASGHDTTAGQAYRYLLLVTSAVPLHS